MHILNIKYLQIMPPIQGEWLGDVEMNKVRNRSI